MLFKYIQSFFFWCTKKATYLFFCTDFIPLLILIPCCIHFADLMVFDFSPDTDDIISLGLEEGVHDKNMVVLPGLDINKTVTKRLKPEEDFFILGGLFGTPTLICRVAKEADKVKYKSYDEWHDTYVNYFIVQDGYCISLLLLIMIVCFKIGKLAVYKFDI